MNVDTMENESVSGNALVRTNLKTIDKPPRINQLLVTYLRPEAIEAESYFNLRHSIEKIRGNEDSIIIALTSPSRGEGKTLTAANLAGALSKDKSNRVLLVDLDLRQTDNGIASYFGLLQPRTRGVVNSVVDNDTAWANASYFIRDFNLYLMPSGKRCNMPYDVLNAPALGRLMENARDFFDYIIIDSPPVLQLTDTRLISQWINGFLVLVTAGKTERRALADTLDILGPEKMLGLVFNGESGHRNPYAPF